MEASTEQRKNFMKALKTNAIMSKSKYDEIISKMKEWSSLLPTERSKKLNKKVYNWCDRYMLKSTKKSSTAEVSGDREELEYFLYKPDVTDKRIIHREEVFDIIYNFHIQNGHKKPRSMWNQLKLQYANISESICQTFVETCPVCQQVPSKKPAHKGAKNPISSLHFRDRFQVDLIDFRSDPREDVNGVMMKWLMVMKDHHTKLTYLRAIKSKEAIQVTRELDHLFGFIGYPLTFHTDNGGEFTAATVVDMLKDWNEQCTTITGRPRTPRDQGSVENVNKHVKAVLSNLGEEDRRKGIEPNWIFNLGKAMASINTIIPSGKNSTYPYHHVFCMHFHDPYTLPIEKVRECNTIDDVLQIANHDDELKSKFMNLGFRFEDSTMIR